MAFTLQALERYVKDLFGLKLHAEGKRRTLESRLRAVIDQADGSTS